MFGPAEVDELFAGTTRALQRSQLLLDERRRTTHSPMSLPATFSSAASSASSTFVKSSMAVPYASSNSFADSVRSLQYLGEFRAYVEAVMAMMEEVYKEVSAPSGGLQQRRKKGNDFALLQSVARGLRGAMGSEWQQAAATASLWSSSAEWTGVDLRDESEKTFAAGAEHPAAPGMLSGNTHRSGAQLAATLLFGALCVDMALMLPRAGPSIARDVEGAFQEVNPQATATAASSAAPAPISEWVRDGQTMLSGLLRGVAVFLPPPVMAQLMERLADLVMRPPPLMRPRAPATPFAHLLGCELLSGGQLLLPMMNYYLMDGYTSSLAVRWFLSPLRMTAQQLRTDYYVNAAQFHLQCRWVLHLMFALLYACQSTPEICTPSQPRPLERHLRTAQRLYDAWLMPLEKTFGDGAARHGMSAAFCHALVKPHWAMVERLLAIPPRLHLATKATAAIPLSTREWAGILHTAQYRLLLVLEKMTLSEVAQANGTSSTSAKQRTYEALLRRNGGKVSAALLQTLAEHEQFVVSEMKARAPDGHRLYKLSGVSHDHGHGGTAVFVYISEGAFFMKVGRAAVFQRVKSVEDIFKPLHDDRGSRGNAT